MSTALAGRRWRSNAHPSMRAQRRRPRHQRPVRIPCKHPRLLKLMVLSFQSLTILASSNPRMLMNTYFNDHVLRIEDKATMLGVKDHVFVRSRWVMCNKGDHIEPDTRARLVACLPLHSKPKRCYSPDMHQSAPENVNH